MPGDVLEQIGYDELLAFFVLNIAYYNYFFDPALREERGERRGTN